MQMVYDRAAALHAEGDAREAADAYLQVRTLETSSAQPANYRAKSGQAGSISDMLIHVIYADC